MALYAGIIVDISIEKLDRPFTYRVRDELCDRIGIGNRVLIPFGRGNREIRGFVISLTDKRPEYLDFEIKDIIDILPEASATGRLIELSAFIADQYGGTLNAALRTCLPMKKSGKIKEVKWVSLGISEEETLSLRDKYTSRHAVAKLRLLDALMSEGELSQSIITDKLQVSSSVIKKMESEGVLLVKNRREYRNPIKLTEGAFYRPKLNEEQTHVYDSIVKDYREGKRDTSLIRGVTGSGKTEVYMELCDYVIKEGKQVILLIPEIALTYQTVMRFYHRFGDRVSVLHSRLSEGEKFDQISRAERGEIDVMIGPRSALFTPFSRLGLIIIDEEHESSYKSEQIPRYHAREVAIKRGQMENAMVVLGSATPSIEASYRAEQGIYKEYLLTKRYEDRKLPEVFLVDLREELKAGNRSMFSRQLKKLMEDRLNKKQQIMLFLNRRGSTGFISCRSCGHTIKCPHCDVSLTAHRDGMLRCHYCGHEEINVKACPKCGSKYIGGFKVGTEKVEDLVKTMFPEARVLRMDADTTRGKDGHEEILSAFSNGEADILVGTQMIVKGHDFPNVTLVGVLAADLSLFSSDYHSAERTFQLLTQAEGRAGRGSEEGKVVVQTYNPEHFAIVTARDQDYESFYREEISYRKLLRYPPVGNLLLIMMTADSEDKVSKLSDDTGEVIKGYGGRDYVMMGPADPTIKKLSDKYRKVIYIKSPSYETLVKIKNKIEDHRREGNYPYGSLSFDFNPNSGF